MKVIGDGEIGTKVKKRKREMVSMEIMLFRKVRLIRFGMMRKKVNRGVRTKIKRSSEDMHLR